jgi:hypothetical protein
VVIRAPLALRGVMFSLLNNLMVLFVLNLFSVFKIFEVFVIKVLSLLHPWTVVLLFFGVTILNLWEELLVVLAERSLEIFLFNILKKVSKLSIDNFNGLELLNDVNRDRAHISTDERHAALLIG